MLKYFKDCRTLQEAKAKFRKLAKENHPDNGGDAAIFKAITAEYERVCKVLPDIDLDKTQTETETQTETDHADISAVLRSAMERAASIPNVNVELCGKWVWVSGNTYPVRENLKQMGFRYSSKKKMWYFREETETRRWRGKHETTIGDIRTKYGSYTCSAKQASLA